MNIPAAGAALPAANRVGGTSTAAGAAKAPSAALASSASTASTSSSDAGSIATAASAMSETRVDGSASKGGAAGGWRIVVQLDRGLFQTGNGEDMAASMKADRKGAMALGPIRQKEGDYAAKPVDAGAAPKSAAV